MQIKISSYVFILIAKRVTPSHVIPKFYLEIIAQTSLQTEMLDAVELVLLQFQTLWLLQTYAEHINLCTYGQGA